MTRRYVAIGWGGLFCQVVDTAVVPVVSVTPSLKYELNLRSAKKVARALNRKDAT